jgi:putative hydrolase
MTSSWVDLSQDWHVHSTFSDGTSSVEENVAEARRVGLMRLMLVDHVRRDTTWVEEFAATAGSAGRGIAGLTVSCGVEAKLLDTGGALDVPTRLPEGVRIVAADHQVPTPDGPAHPREIRIALESGDLTPRQVIDWIADATVAAIGRYPEILVAHLFSILPKVGLAESVVSDAHLARLAAAAARHGAIVEISERWRCPGPRAIAAMRSAGVRIVPSTDSHARATIGRYTYVRDAVHGTGASEEERPPERK